MYDILIAEDEAVEREVIRFLLEKNGFPLRITEVANGLQALEQLKKQPFHILLTDIRMPFIDGLELAKQARELYPELHIVFFSGYDDFDYARRALSLRIVNYILKPVDPAELERTLSQVIEQLREREQQQRKEQSLRGAVHRSALLQLINGVELRRLQVMYPQWNFDFLSEYHRMLLLRMEDGTGYLPWEVIRPLLPEGSVCVMLRPGSGAVFLGGRRHQSKWYLELEAAIGERILAVSGRCRMELSGIIRGPEEIHRTYLELKTALRDRSFLQAEATAQEQLLPQEEDALLKAISTDLRLQDAEGLRRDMEALMDSFRDRSGVRIRYLCTKVLTLLLDDLSLDPAAFDEYARSIQEEPFSVIETMLRELTERLAEEFSRGSRSQSHGVLLAKQYIRKNYRQALSLNIIADQVHLSPRYLSALFVEEEGLGINRYIKKVRMEKARQLLIGTNMTVSRISKEVGYTNLSYFCKSFQDEFGMTPDRFRSSPPEGKGATDDLTEN